jgi:hypothetical protein
LVVSYGEQKLGDFFKNKLFRNHQKFDMDLTKLITPDEVSQSGGMVRTDLSKSNFNIQQHTYKKSHNF